MGGGGGINLPARLFGNRTQWPHLRLDSRRVRHLGEGTMREGKAGRALPWGVIPWYSLQTEKQGKPLVKVAKGVCWA